ncbi:MAG: 30S ribosomal protein S17 [Chloroflexota bacterium]
MNSKHKTLLGSVATKKMDKTVVVAVQRLRHAPLYRKLIREVVKFKAHDEKNECAPGDKVRIMETRPLSKEKHWKVIEIVVRGKVAEIKPEEIK